MPLISIITVNYNNAGGLKKTIESVDKQCFFNFEHIIIDANSTDDSLSIIKNYHDSNKKYQINFLSEKDNGIYDGMNKGISLAKGHWLYFLNSGDTLFDNDVLKNVKLDFLTNYNVVYGKLSREGQSSTPFLEKVLEYGLIHASHQAMFIKNITTYNDKYKIYGDYEMLARIYKLAPTRFLYIDMLIAEREEGGISSVVSWRKRYEKIIATYKNFGFKSTFIALFWKYLKVKHVKNNSSNV